MPDHEVFAGNVFREFRMPQLNYPGDILGGFHYQEYRAHPAPKKTGDPIQNTRNELKYSGEIGRDNLKNISETLNQVEKQRAEEREANAKEVSTLERRVAELEEALRTVQRLNPYDSGVKLIIAGVGVAV